MKLYRLTDTAAYDAKRRLWEKLILDDGSERWRQTACCTWTGIRNENGEPVFDADYALLERR